MHSLPPLPPPHTHALPCRYSEQSRTKCIGMTIETRPDFCLTPHLSQMLSYGCTRLEIGLQARGSSDALLHCPCISRCCSCGCPLLALPGPAEYVRGCGTRYQPRAHRGGCGGVLPPSQGRWLQGGHAACCESAPLDTTAGRPIHACRAATPPAGHCPHDAGPAQRGVGARHRELPRVFRKPRLPHRRPQGLPDPGHPRHRAVRAVEEGAVHQLLARQGQR